MHLGKWTPYQAANLIRQRWIQFTSGELNLPVAYLENPSPYRVGNTVCSLLPNYLPRLWIHSPPIPEELSLNWLPVLTTRLSQAITRRSVATVNQAHGEQQASICYWNPTGEQDWLIYSSPNQALPEVQGISEPIDNSTPSLPQHRVRGLTKDTITDLGRHSQHVRHSTRTEARNERTISTQAIMCTHSLWGNSWTRRGIYITGPVVRKINTKIRPNVYKWDWAIMLPSPCNKGIYILGSVLRKMDI